MSIKIKILIPTVAMSIIIAVSIFISNIIQFNVYADTVLTDRLNASSRAIDNDLERIKTLLQSSSLLFANDNEIKHTLDNRNYEALQKRAKELYGSINVGFVTVTDAEGIARARPHKPESLGDDISSTYSIKAALTGKSMINVEGGSSVILSICASTPILDDTGRILGVASVGYRLDTNDFVDLIKNTLGCEATVFFGDERISTTILKEDGTRAIGTRASIDVYSTVTAGSAYIGEVEVFGKEMITKYTPLNNSDGKTIGMLLVGRYLTEKSDVVTGFIKTGTLITLLLLAVVITVIVLTIQRIIMPLRSMVEAAHVLGTGDTDVVVSVNTNDETRDLAEAFNSTVAQSKQLSLVLKSIAEGDLTMSVDAHSDKDILNLALISLIDRTNMTFSQVSATTDQVSTEAKQIADGAQLLAQGATEQASAIEQLSSSIGEIAENTRKNANIAREAAELSENIKLSAENGSEQMEQMMQSVMGISEASKRIEKVIKVIDDIAFQTNILALNAAVEAARAGIHGKGFAVVAEEVRNLAAKSAEAAKETGELIENSADKVNTGLDIAMETSASLRKIVEGINRSADIVTEIAKSSDSQANAITQIDTGIEQMAQIVQQNSATAEEFAAASEEMNGQTDMLEQLISHFKLKNPNQSSSKPALPDNKQLKKDKESVNKLGKYQF